MKEGGDIRDKNPQWAAFASIWKFQQGSLEDYAKATMAGQENEYLAKEGEQAEAMLARAGLTSRIFSEKKSRGNIILFVDGAKFLQCVRAEHGFSNENENYTALYISGIAEGQVRLLQDYVTGEINLDDQEKSEIEASFMEFFTILPELADELDRIRMEANHTDKVEFDAINGLREIAEAARGGYLKEVLRANELGMLDNPGRGPVSIGGKSFAIMNGCINFRNGNADRKKFETILDFLSSLGAEQRTRPFFEKLKTNALALFDQALARLKGDMTLEERWYRRPADKARKDEAVSRFRNQMAMIAQAKKDIENLI